MMREWEKNLKIGENSNILCENISIGHNVNIGNDVLIKCNRLVLGDNIDIGLETEDNFRNTAGVRINVDTLSIGSNTTIGKEVLVEGGVIEIGSECTVRECVTINVKKKLHLGDCSTIGLNFQMSGIDIEIGDALRSLDNVVIGGGSAFEIHSKLRIGQNCHLGNFCFINTARPVYIGNEVGLGQRTSLYTHGAYQSILKGYPVEFGEIVIGDNCWLPGAIVNPNVHIGKDTVIGVGSVVTRDIPPGSLAVGIPAKVIQKAAYPKNLNIHEKNNIILEILKVFGELLSDDFNVVLDTNDGDVLLKLSSSSIIAFKDTADSTFLDTILMNNVDRAIIISFKYPASIKNTNHIQCTYFNLDELAIEGVADDLSERLRDQLRRYGIRFNYSPKNEVYVSGRKI